MLGNQDSRVTCRSRNDDVDLATDEFGHQLWEEGDVPLSVAILQDDVFPLQ